MGLVISYSVVMTAQIDHENETSRVTFAQYDATIARLRAATTARLKTDHDAAAATAKQAMSATPNSAATITCHNLLTSHGNPSSIDILVNKAHCLSPLDFTPADLQTVGDATLSAKAMPHLTDMLSAAATAGSPLTVTSSYRSYADQVATYSSKIAAEGSTSTADTTSARPGYSEHQTGLAVDLRAGNCALECLATTTQYAWLQAHAADFGFIQRYPSGSEGITGYNDEAWHYRYVGTTVAKDMKTRAIKTLEEYWRISGGDYPS